MNFFAKYIFSLKVNNMLDIFYLINLNRFTHQEYFMLAENLFQSCKLIQIF